MANTTLTAESVAPMRQRQTMEFPYKHSTGETIGRFLAGLKEQKRIWGQRVSGQGVVVPPLGYSEVDGSDAGEWVEVKDTGVVTAAARVDKPIERLHPSTSPFAFVLVKLDGADTALAHIIKGDLDRVAVGARVQVVWAADEARVGSIRDIDSFQVIADAPAPAPKPAPKAAAKPAKAAPSAKKPVTAKSAKSATSAKKPAAKKPAAKKAVTTKGTKGTKKPTPKKVVAAKSTKAKAAKTRAKVVKPRPKKPAAKKPAAKKANKPARAKARKPVKAKVSKASIKRKAPTKKPARGKAKPRRR